MGESEKGNTMSQISPTYVTGLDKYINELRNQVSSLKTELREICTAIDDPASDLTLTTVECIKKLKVENESLKRDAERLDWVEHQDFYDLSFAVLVDQPNDGMIAVSIGEGWHLGNNLREAIDAAMAKGETGMNTEMTTRETEPTAQVAALELEVVSLRSVMANVIKAHGYEGGTPTEVMSTPFTPTTLNELIEKVEKRTIERCLGKTYGRNCAYDAIRALPTGQIKLEELL